MNDDIEKIMFDQDALNVLVDDEEFFKLFNRAKNCGLIDPLLRVFSATVPMEEQVGVRFVRIPQKLSEGYYLADAVSNNQHVQTWFQMTPVASFLALSGTKTLFWLKDLSSGNALAGSEIFFDGAKIGKTGNDGVAMFDTPMTLIRKVDASAVYSYESPISQFFTVRAGKSTFAVPIENEYGTFAKVSPPDSWWDYLSIDKTIYLPTDTVRFWGAVKHRNDVDIRGENLTIQLINPYWYGASQSDITVYGETKAVVSDFSTLTGEIKFSDLKPGLYQLAVKRGNEIIVSENINIETYTKPAYKLTITPDKDALFAGDSVAYRVKAEFFDGTPVPRLKVRYNAYFSRTIEGEIELNSDGEGSFEIKTDYAEGPYDWWPKYLGMNVSPVLAEEGEINAYVSALVFGPHMDLRSDQSLAEKVSKFDLKLRNVVLEKIQKGEPYWVSANYLGDPVPGWTIDADVTEIIYKRTEVSKGYDIINKITYPIYNYSTEEKPTTKTTLTTDARGEAHFEWTPEEKKTYRITFTTRDTAGRLVKRQHYVYGGPFSYFEDYDSRGITLKNLDEKTEYGVGEPIRLELQNSGGNALGGASGRFLYMRAHDGVDAYTIADSAEYADVFKEAYIPNVNIFGVWFSGSRFHDAYPVNISFRSDEHRLSIDVGKDKDRYRPRDTVKLGFRVTDKNGQPKEAEVNVAGIDEAVFSLNPEEKDITSNLYRDNFPSLVTRSSHFTPLEQGAEIGGCFVAGTNVSTPRGAKPIEELHKGDVVLAWDSRSPQQTVESRIERTGSYLVAGYLVFNGRLKVSTNHSLRVNGAWQEAGAVKPGDVLLDESGKNEVVRSVVYVPKWLRVYNIEVENEHTFFAEGVLVHNEEKGGGGVQTDFRDMAIYTSVRTDRAGRAEASFALPDNLTSWRITTQAVTKDLFAGKNVTFIPVSLPFFVDATLNRTYLAGDDFTLRVRTFGTANPDEHVQYVVESESLPFKKIERIGGRSVDISLGKLPAGSHTLKISAKSGEYSDWVHRKSISPWEL